MIQLMKKHALQQIMGDPEKKGGEDQKSSLRILSEELIDAVQEANPEAVENCLRACYADLSQPPKEE